MYMYTFWHSGTATPLSTVGKFHGGNIIFFSNHDLVGSIFFCFISTIISHTHFVEFRILNKTILQKLPAKYCTVVIRQYSPGN